MKVAMIRVLEVLFDIVFFPILMLMALVAGLISIYSNVHEAFTEWMDEDM